MEVWQFRAKLEAITNANKDDYWTVREAGKLVEKYREDKDKTLTRRVRDWVSVSSGQFSVSSCYSALGIVSGDSNSRGTVRQAVHQLKKEGVIESFGKKNEQYRRVEHDFKILDWENAPTDEYPIRYPFELEGYFKTFPGDLVILAGYKSSGKTAFCFSLIGMNMHQHRILYMTSEMHETTLKERLSLFTKAYGKEKDIKWNFTPGYRVRDWSDLIDTKKYDLFIVDYMQAYGDDYPYVGQWITDVHEKLGGKAMCLICLQKEDGKDLGRGGYSTIEKAQAYLTIQKGELKMYDCKAWRGENNPTGIVNKFKLVKGSKFIPGVWHHPDDAKLAASARRKK